MTLMLLNGCATNTIVIHDFCDKYIPIHPSESQDTEETLKQIALNNVVYETLNCKGL